MSGLARTFNQSMKKEINAYAAWFPVSNTFKIGDFGLIEGGVFRSVGNLAGRFPEIELKVEAGPPSKIDFVSSGTRMIRFGVGGEVDSFSALGNAEAKLKLQFDRKNSVVVKANLRSEQLINIEDVALKVSAKSSWNNSYKIISSVYVGEKCVVICSREAGTEVVLEGKANVLKQVEAGKVDGVVSITASKNSVFKSIGETGVICFKMFRIGGRDGFRLLGPVKPSDLEIQTDFGRTLKDDF